MIEPSAEFTLAAAFALGLAGNVHCLAMCGGIATAFSQLSGDADGRIGAPATRLDRFARAARVLQYNLGRVASYTLAGAIAGGFGFLFGSLTGGVGAFALRLALGLTLVFAGLYLAGWNRALTRLESLGRPVWSRLSAAVSPLRPVDRASKAFLLGAIWGWLPCGLSYTALVGAAATGSIEHGALGMVGFGFGTLPGMLFAGILSDRLRGFVRRAPVRAVAGLLVVALGFWTISGAFLVRAHWGHGNNPSPVAAEGSLRDSAPAGSPHDGHTQH